MITGYCLLILGNSPAYRIVYKPTVTEALKAIPTLKAESGGRVEILRMWDGDTLQKQPESDEFITKK